MDTNVGEGAKPPKEMRTYQRDGNVIREDHEKLNPDGTVTKTITMTDELTGQRQVSVYKMDKSGIVRKLDEKDLQFIAESSKKDALVQQMKDLNAQTKAKIDAIREHTEKVNSKSVAYETGDGAYLKRVEENAEPDKYEMAYSLRNLNKPIQLTPKQQAMIREHKENILNYGTQKLIKQLNNKLSEDKFNETYSLTDEQKDKVIEYGIRKLHRLLEKNLDDERLIYDVMSFNPDFGDVDLSGRGERLIPGDQPVSFSLNPYDDISPDEIAKPVSFSMRPEKQSKPLPEKENHGEKREVNKAYQALWNKISQQQSSTEPVGGMKTDNGNSNHNKYETDNEKTDSDWQSDSAPDPKEKMSFKNLKQSVKKIIADDESYQKSPLTEDEKDDIINHALKQIKSAYKDSMDEKEKRKKKIDLSDYFDEDEIYEYGKKVLKRLVRRSLKAFGLNQDMIRKDLRDPEESARRDGFFQYLGDIIEGRAKESDPLPIKENKLAQEEELDGDSKWDYQTLMKSLFGKKGIENKPQKLEEKPKDEPKKISDFDSLLTWLKDIKDIKAMKETSQSSETVPKIKPHFYQLEPKVDSTNEPNQTKSESKGFDLKSLLRKIQEAAVKRFSESKSPESTEKSANLEHPPLSRDSSVSSQERQQKQSDIDAAVARLRQNNNEPSKKPTVKPPYLKERIAGLDTIPRPTIMSVSPPKQNADFNEQISFSLKPQSYEITNQQQDKSRPLENQRIEATKPCSHEQDFQPWWFESPESFVKKAFDKPLIKEGFIDDPMISTSFSTGGDGFSARKALRN